MVEWKYCNKTCHLTPQAGTNMITGAHTDKSDMIDLKCVDLESHITHTRKCNTQHLGRIIGRRWDIYR